MKVSIIVPMRNASTTVEATLKSLLDQSYKNFEVIVVNDRSEDDGVEKVHRRRDERVRVIDNEGKGQSDALNTGLKVANGELFMRCDADDLYEPGRLLWQVDYLRNRSEVAAVCGFVTAIREDSREIAPMVPKISDGDQVSSRLAGGEMVSHLGAYAIRIHAARSVGFRPFFIYSQDSDFLFRLGERFQITYCNKSAYRIRFIDTSVCRTTPLELRMWYKEMAQEFRRQRISSGDDDLNRGNAPVPPTILSKKTHGTNDAIQNILFSAAWRMIDQNELPSAFAYAKSGLLERPWHFHSWTQSARMLMVALRNKIRSR